MDIEKDLPRIFEKKWIDLAFFFPRDMAKEIKEETKNRLKNLGRYKITNVKQIEGIIAAELYEAQKAVILSKIVKPKTTKEIAEMFGISSATISNRRKRN